MPEGATLNWVIRFSCPHRFPKWSLLIKSHMWIDESSDEQNNILPEDERPVEVKLELGDGGLNTVISWSERRSQSREVLSSEQVTKLLPQGWKANELTSASWPQKVCWHWSVLKSHRRMVLSTEPVKNLKMRNLRNNSLCLELVSHFIELRLYFSTT